MVKYCEHIFTAKIITFVIPSFFIRQNYDQIYSKFTIIDEAT